ncbi:acyl-coenzyme A amino acid N-acyltransferase 1-like [Patiria miniata]|uniref:Uncharacterized protein n=1 Tax=Patiria miniata TaxID=46514 RepID=A0A914BBR0_PATMI|nr:acyl-coenzyme A amino acid N-acyltransferase 1-like [Patiria miniata]XP_038073475.1 acyl-coenzyme A amino acid N-acyltransferase 1-like [Patiria miniata]XP_038073476.1 acyl-coenzyme A amino acid N-acyltransferase 1-like [Patiria miniata]
MSTSQFESTMRQPRLLTVAPFSSLVDSKVTIRATGMKANSPVTIRSFVQQETRRSGFVKFEAHAHYIADDRGVVSVPDQMSLGGTYTGAEPMGLFWSMVPSPGQRFGIRFIVKDVTEPMVVHLSLHRGHLDTKKLQTAEPEATTTAERRYMGQNVERITVHSGRLRGTLFKPKGSGPFPGVIDMFGSTGGLIEIRAAMLASRGLACYALPYFSYDDLPASMWNLELEYFKEAVDWLCGQPFVRPGGIGMVGVSSGAQIVFAMAAHFPEKVRAVISINGCHVHTLFPLTVNGVPVPYITCDIGSMKPAPTEGAQSLFDTFKAIYDMEEDNHTIYRIENATNCQFLFITGEGDELWDSCYYAREAMKRLARHGRHNYQLLTYPGAGHLIEVLYSPVAMVVYSIAIGSVVDHGGTIKDTAKAMEDSWPKMVKFLHNYCGRNNSKL